MIQRFHFWVFICRKRKHNSKKYIPLCSLQHYVQQPKYGSNLNVHQWMSWWCNKMQYTQTHRHTQTHTHRNVTQPLKKNEILPFVATQMELEGNMLNEISQREKNKYHMISFIYKNQTKQTNKTETDSQIQKTNCSLPREGVSRKGPNR